MKHFLRVLLLIVIVCGTTRAQDIVFEPDTLRLGVEFNSIKNSIFAPDFAFPADVQKTARAFLKASPPAVGSKVSGERLLAVEEDALASLAIDSQDINNVLQKVLELAESEQTAASRAMFLCYAGWLCRTKYYFSRGYLKTPDPNQIAIWGSSAFSAAADSLFELAFNVAPTNAPLKDFSEALTPLFSENKLVDDVRTFVLFEWTYNFSRIASEKIPQLIDTYPDDSALRMFYAVKRMTDVREKREFILNNLSNSNSIYALAALLLEANSDRTQDWYDFYSKIKPVFAGTWVENAIEENIKYIRSPKWSATLPDVVADVTYDFILTSQNIESITFNIYRYDRETKAELSQLDKKHLYRTVSFTPKSGFNEKKDTVKLSLPYGYYIISCPDQKYATSSSFVVSPWVVTSIQNRENANLIQVLNPVTGKGVKGIEVTASLRGLKNVNVTNVTDDDGIAEFTKPINETVVLKDKTSGFEISCDGMNTRSWYSSAYSIDEEEKNIHEQIVTDRRVYRPGDTVKWLMVVTKDKTTTSDFTTKITIKLPNDERSYNVLKEYESEPTDGFGRISGEFVIPRDCPLGYGYIETDETAYGFKVADFRLPELRFNNINNIFEGDSVIISGVVLNQVDAPRPDTKIVLSISGRNFKDSLNTDSDGRFRFVIPRNLKYPDSRDRAVYNGVLTTSYTLEGSTVDGYHITSNGSFAVNIDAYVYVKSDSPIDISDGLTFEISTELLGVEDKQKPIMCEWVIVEGSSYLKDYFIDTVNPILRGEAMTGTVTLSADVTKKLTAGDYRIAARAKDYPSYQGSRYVVVYNTQTSDLPGSSFIFVPQNTFNKTNSETTEVMIGCSANNVTLWYADESVKSRQPKSLTLKKGFRKINLPGKDSDKILMWAYREGKRYSGTIYFEGEPENADTLSLGFETFRTSTTADSDEHWTIVTRYKDRPISAAVCLNVYDIRLNTLGYATYLYIRRPYNLVRKFDISMYFGRFSTPTRSRLYFSTNPHSYRSAISNFLMPTWRYTSTKQGYGDRGYETDDFISLLQGQVSGLAVSSRSNAFDMGAVEMELADEVLESMSDSSVAGYGTLKKAAAIEQMESPRLYGARASTLAMVQQVKEQPTIPDDLAVRENTIFTALWRPMLTTDSLTGAVDVDFVIPNQSTTWEVRATAWTKDLVSKTKTLSFTATKPLSVKPNVPRFVRVGDTVNIVTAVTNMTDSAQSVLFDVKVGERTNAGRFELGPRGVHYVTTCVSVDGMAALADSLSFTFRASNGRYGDGEKCAIPILPSTALLTESNPFYMNPADTSFTTTIETPHNSETRRTELHFTANPMWTVVDAIPSVIDNYEDVMPLAGSYAQAWYVAKTAQKIVEEHPAAAEIINSDKAKKLRKDALEKLSRMQLADGSFSWGSWNLVPSFYTTLSVLSWFDEDVDDDALNKLKTKALEYLDNNICDEKVRGTYDLSYSTVRSAFGAPTTLAAKETIDITVNATLKMWKEMTLGNKCIAALLLSRTGYKATAQEVLRSIVQHGVVTPDRGLTFPNMPSLTDYANLLLAFHAVEPTDTIIDAVRQGLVCLRRGASWGNSAYTCYAVRAMVKSGTDWTVPAESVEVKVDGNTVPLPPTVGLTGSFTLPVDGSDITISRHAEVPAYGAVVNMVVAPLSAVAEFGTNQLSISKTITGTLKPGEKVKVSLRIFTDRDLTNVIVEDSRSAAFEPIDQTGVYRRSESGAWYYLQNANTASNIFFNRLPRGYTTVEYEVAVNNSGTFTSGVATVTCGEDPDLTAHSASSVLVINP